MHAVVGGYIDIIWLLLRWGAAPSDSTPVSFKRLDCIAHFKPLGPTLPLLQDGTDCIGLATLVGREDVAQFLVSSALVSVAMVSTQSQH